MPRSRDLAIFVLTMTTTQGRHTQQWWLSADQCMHAAHAKVRSEIVLFQAPNPCAGKGLVILEQFLACTGTWLNCNIMQYPASCTFLCNGMQNCRAFWLARAKPRHCIMLLPNGMQNQMKIIELRSDWLTQIHDCWACKNQENAQLSPDPSLAEGGVWGWD